MNANMLDRMYIYIYIYIYIYWHEIYGTYMLTIYVFMVVEMNRAGKSGGRIGLGRAYIGPKE